MFCVSCCCVYIVYTVLCCRCCVLSHLFKGSNNTLLMLQHHAFYSIIPTRCPQCSGTVNTLTCCVLTLVMADFTAPYHRVVFGIHTRLAFSEGWEMNLYSWSWRWNLLSPVCHAQAHNAQHIHNTSLILLHEWPLPPDPLGRGKDTIMWKGNFIMMGLPAALTLHPTSVWPVPEKLGSACITRLCGKFFCPHLC